MKDINQILYYVIMVALPLIYLFAYFKYKRAKSLDNTLKLKLGLRSKIESYSLIALSIAYILYPVEKEAYGVAVFLGALLVLLVYLSLERLTIVGRKVLFTRFLAFDVKMIQRRSYRNGRFIFYIGNGRIKVFLPVSDMDYLNEMLSGNQRQRRKLK